MLISGAVFGRLAQWIRLPSVTGQIVAGALLGSSVLGVIPDATQESLRPLTHFALALIAVTVGAHLSARRLRNAGRRLIYMLVLEALLTPALVLGGLTLLTEIRFETALLLGTVAISTAPATIVALVREGRARGVFVTTLIAAVALNNIACVVLFEVARTVSRARLDLGGASSVSALLAAPVRQVAGAAVLGLCAAVTVTRLSRRFVRLSTQTTMAVAALLVVIGASQVLEVSPLLAALAFGVGQTNLTPRKEELLPSFFTQFEPAILGMFFTIAGLHLRLDHALRVAGIAALYFGLRGMGKVLSSALAMRLANAPARLQTNLGLALIPQAGVAVGLVVLIEDDAVFAAIQGVFVGVVLTVVTVNEIVGPILTRLGLSRSGERDKDRARVLDFLQEENITIQLAGATKEEAITQLVDLLVRVHPVEGADRSALLGSVLAREAQLSTCVGEGLAIPHAELPHGHRMVGVMGISRQGLPLDTPDGKPVHCMVLLATPPDQRNRHLEVLAVLARTIGTVPLVREALFRAETAAHAYEILHLHQEAEDFNRYLEAEPAG